MTPHEMEEQLENLHDRTTTIEPFLPTLATKDDLRLTKEDLRREILATKDDLRLTTEALHHEIETGFQEAKNHADRLNEITAAQIRLLRGEMIAMNGELRGEMIAKNGELRGEMAAMRADLRGEMAAMRADLRGDMAAMKEDLRSEMATKRDLQELRRALSKQISALLAPRRKKR